MVKHIANCDRVIFKSDVIWDLLTWVRTSESSLARYFFNIYDWTCMCYQSYMPQFLICSCSELTWRTEHECLPPMSQKILASSRGSVLVTFLTLWLINEKKQLGGWDVYVSSQCEGLQSIMAVSALWQWELCWLLAYVGTNQKEFRREVKPSYGTSAAPQELSIYQKSYIS